MLVLSTLPKLLSQVLAAPVVHTAILLTPEGQLISYVSYASRPKDEIRVLVGLGSEVWQETRKQGVGMVDSEFGRILVLPVQRVDEKNTTHNEPLMLIALNAEPEAEWGDLQVKARGLANHLVQPVEEFKERLTLNSPSPNIRVGRTQR